MVRQPFYVLPSDVRDKFKIKYIKMDMDQLDLIAVYQHIYQKDKEFTARKKVWYSNDHLKHNIVTTPGDNMYLSDVTIKEVDKFLTYIFTQAAMLHSPMNWPLFELSEEAVNDL